MEPKPDLIMNIEKLLNAENPCQWKPICEPENLHEVDREEVGDGQFSFHNFVIDMIKSYNEYEKENISKALEIIEDLEKKISGQKHDGQGLFFVRIEEAVNHTLLTMKAVLLMRSNKTEECLKVFRSVTSVGDMDASNRAGIYAIRSACQAIYSFEGTRTALSRINMAIKADPATPYWIFLKATYLQKLRKVQSPNDSPSLEERELFKEAAEKEENPLFMVHQADVLREMAVSNMKRQEKYFWFLPDQKAKNDMKQKAKDICETSLELYKRSYALKPRCPLIAFRCAYGLMMLPQLYQDIKQAKLILHEMMPKHLTSGFGYFVYAMYLDSFGKNSGLAAQYLETAVELNVFIAHINMIRIRFRDQGSKFDPVAELRRMREKFKETPKLGMIVSQLVSYYILVKNDLKQACEYTIEYFKIPNHGNTLQVHRSCFHSTDEPFALIDVVTDGVKYAMGNPKLTSDLRAFYQTFVHFMNFENYVVLKGVPQNLRKQILEGQKLKSEPWYDKAGARIASRGGKSNAFEPRTNQGKNKPKNWPSVDGGSKSRFSQPPHQTYQPKSQTMYQPNQVPSTYRPTKAQSKYQPCSAPADSRNIKGSQISSQPRQFFDQFKAAPPLVTDSPKFREHKDRPSPSLDRRSRYKHHSPDGRRRHRQDSADSRHRRRRDSCDSAGSRRRRRRDSYDSADERRRRHRRHRRRSPSSSSSYDRDSSYERRDRRRAHGRRRSYSSGSDVSPYRRRRRHRRRRSRDTSSDSSSFVERRRTPSRHRRRDERKRRSKYSRSPSGRSAERNAKGDQRQADGELVGKMRDMKLDARGVDKRGSKHRAEEGRESSVGSAGSRGRAGKRVESHRKHREERKNGRSGQRGDREDEGELEVRADRRDRRKGDARSSGRKGDREADAGESDSRSSRRCKEKSSPTDERGQRKKGKSKEQLASEAELPAKTKGMSDQKTRDHARSKDDEFEPYRSSSD